MQKYRIVYYGISNKINKNSNTTFIFWQKYPHYWPAVATVAGPSGRPATPHFLPSCALAFGNSFSDNCILGITRKMILGLRSVLLCTV